MENPVTGQVASIIQQNSESTMNSTPAMAVYISDLAYDRERVQNPTYVGKLKVGTEVDVYLTSLGKTYTGKVRQVGNFINPSNRSFGIEVAVPNPQGLLRPNQVAKLRIIDYVNKNALVVPSNVILKDANGDNYVYVVTEVNGKTGKAKKVIVKTEYYFFIFCN
jgi:multidrug efflux pump subunit AcrA (membrane-fusion protein)